MVGWHLLRGKFTERRHLLRHHHLDILRTVIPETKPNSQLQVATNRVRHSIWDRNSRGLHLLLLTTLKLTQTTSSRLDPLVVEPYSALTLKRHHKACSLLQCMPIKRCQAIWQVMPETITKSIIREFQRRNNNRSIKRLPHLSGRQLVTKPAIIRRMPHLETLLATQRRSMRPIRQMLASPILTFLFTSPRITRQSRLTRPANQLLGTIRAGGPPVKIQRQLHLMLSPPSIPPTYLTTLSIKEGKRKQKQRGRRQTMI